MNDGEQTDEQTAPQEKLAAPDQEPRESEEEPTAPEDGPTEQDEGRGPNEPDEEPMEQDEDPIEPEKRPTEPDEKTEPEETIAASEPEEPTTQEELIQSEPEEDEPTLVPKTLKNQKRDRTEETKSTREPADEGEGIPDKKAPKKTAKAPKSEEASTDPDPDGSEREQPAKVRHRLDR